MITHKELLNKFANRIGAQESFGRLALEEFAYLISQNLNFGDQLEVPSLGFFTFKKVKPLNSTEKDFQQIIIFSEKRLSDSDANFIFFFLPNSSLNKRPSIDSWLNLSFNLPTIATLKKSQNDLITVISEDELLSLIQSKTEKLFHEGVIHKNLVESEEELDLSKFAGEIIFDTGILEPEEHSLKSEPPENIRVFEDIETQNNTSQNEIASSYKSYEADEEARKSVEIVKPARKKRKVFILSALALLIIIAGVYFNFEHIQQLIFKQEHQNSFSLLEKKFRPVIIEPNYNIPISSNNELKSEVVDSLIINISPADMKPSSSLDSLTSEVIELSTDDVGTTKNKFVRVQGYVYQRDDKYFVQISSWKAKSKAENEVKKFNDLGYNAELIIYNSSELGKYYKVMVGSFESIDEAKNFFKQNN